jgi:hypothetical protein
MSCQGCRKHYTDKKHEEREKTRRLAKRIAEIEGRTQIILEYEGEISITCEECWIKGGRIGSALEYIIV